MASTVTTSGVTLRRGTPTNLGTLAAGQVAQFSVPQASTATGNMYLAVTAYGGTGQIALAVSFDAGAHWAGVAVITGRLTTTTLNADPAVGDAELFDISGLAGGLFRVGDGGGSAQAQGTVIALVT
jgi:hypothetical protein